MENRKTSRLKDRRLGDLVTLVFLMAYQNMGSCWCINEEGEFLELGLYHISRNLKDLCLEGTLAPEIGYLTHIKSIILRNNSFSGIIPDEIGELEELEVLDLGYNNFSGLLPDKLGNNLSLAILLIDNNELLAALSPEVQELKIISEAQVDESLLTASAGVWCKTKLDSQNEDCRGTLYATQGNKRVLLQSAPSPYLRSNNDPPSKPPAPVTTSHPPFKYGMLPIHNQSQQQSPVLPSSPAPSPLSNQPSSPALTPSSSPNQTNSSPSQTGAPSPTPSNSENHTSLIIGISIGGFALVFFIILGVHFYRRDKVTMVKPWATGLSGQLQKAFVAGVPKLKRSELELACEDFSNVVGTSSTGTIYKGTLSNGVEIAVVSFAVKSIDDWSKSLEAQFRKKIDMLSRVNHKNFVNLIGYCQEEQPFTRMMVFEYAPNGTLFEHLHIKEAEHLDWGMRVRIAMGMAYCLEHMHQLSPPIPHKKLNSSAVALTEDYAGKISEFNFWNQIADSDVKSSKEDLLEDSPEGPEQNVYGFGVILFEMVTGRLPYSVEDDSTEDWASDYIKGDKPLAEMVDPTLSSFAADQVEKMDETIRSCVHPDPKERPSMKEVTSRLRAVTGIPPDEAVPKISPLWWAELEILQ
ncbi:hypothetical protein SAY86_027160 [Trapa natans]|uniref:Protein kinase domain-containing protein n=1 Tax=Trapa natans TaxID=22666 RepID=A0AAN7QLT0_TRANT|nr:hypothetical protein SAY86_027160 [Trapa natans]